jgi:hypothetical protein
VSRVVVRHDHLVSLAVDVSLERAARRDTSRPPTCGSEPSRNGAGLRALTKTWFEDSDPGYGSGDNRGSRLTTWAGRGEKFMNRGIIGTIIGVLVIIILVIVIMQMT